jgi:uncharacterized membrane protein
MVFIKILKIKIDDNAIILFVFLLFAPAIVAISTFLSRNYKEEEENNNSLFVGILIILVFSFFFIVWKFS